MKRVVWYISDLIACGVVRGVAPAAGINRLRTEWICDVKTNVVYSDLERCDVMVFQRSDNPLQLAWMQQAKKLGIGCIYDLDDDFWNMPEGFPTLAHTGETPAAYYRRHLPHIEALIATADVVTVSTNTLAELVSARMLARGVVVDPLVIPNCIDLPMWQAGYEAARRSAAQRAAEQTVTIGWVASGSHVIDAPMLLPALERIMREHDEVHLKLGGWTGTVPLDFAAQFPGRVVVGEWVPFDQLPMALSAFDIAICCITDTAFNRSKSACKWQEASAVGVPCVVANLPPYAACKPCIRVATNDSEGWYQGLKEAVLIGPRIRHDMGEAARARIVKDESSITASMAWVTAFGAAILRPFPGTQLPK